MNVRREVILEVCSEQYLKKHFKNYLTKKSSYSTDVLSSREVKNFYLAERNMQYGTINYQRDSPGF